VSVTHGPRFRQVWSGQVEGMDVRVNEWFDDQDHYGLQYASAGPLPITGFYYCRIVGVVLPWPDARLDQCSSLVALGSTGAIPAGPVLTMVSLVADSCRYEAFHFSRIELHSVGIGTSLCGATCPEFPGTGSGPSWGTHGRPHPQVLLG